MSEDPTAASCVRKDPIPRLRSRLLNLLPGSLQSLAFGCFLELPKLIFGRRVCDLYFGAKISLDLGDFLQRYIYFFGFWEPNISCAVTDILKPGDVFVDIGAHVGYDTLLAASVVGRSGSVYSFEADPNTYASLAANINMNKLTNVTMGESTSASMKVTGFAFAISLWQTRLFAERYLSSLRSLCS